MPVKRVDASELGTNRTDSVGELVGVQTVIEPPMSCEPMSQFPGKTLSGIGAHQSDLRIRERQKGCQESVGRLHRVRGHEYYVHHQTDRTRPASTV